MIDLHNKIFVLDGAMGTMIQRYPLEDCAYNGNNDMLNILRPEIIEQIHLQYIEAGSDIITTNTFNGNRISQGDYDCREKVREINLRGAEIARKAADSSQRKIYVAGSMGPTNKMLFLASDVNHPELRTLSFDEMVEAYTEQAEALSEGGVDMLLVETVFDALNAKAALYAIRKVVRDIPIMVSASINDKSGRLLSGHTLEALYTSLSHFNLMSFGLNCSFGAKDLMPFIEQVSGFAKCAVSIYPNAGLPDEMGQYKESPDYTATCISEMARNGLINIVGGCCGTTPEHIRAISQAVDGYKSRTVPMEDSATVNEDTVVCGLEKLIVNRKQYNFINVGERTNVAGSAKFAKLIRAKEYDKAADIARRQIEDGATIIDINMDDAMLDSPREMAAFLRYIDNDPDIAKVPYMIDSSNWETILQGLKNSSGKSVVNSISLKEGEVEFLRKASEIFALGAAVIVMAFDEQGQAVTFDRKRDICLRAYHLLREKIGFSPRDIIFDVNILTIATGMEEHNNYAVDFINAVRWIKANLPGCKTSGGVSNLSFAFRGNNKVREAMHSVFLYHAIDAGLDMAIVNPSMLQLYDDIEPTLLAVVSAAVLNDITLLPPEYQKYSSPSEALVALADEIRSSSSESDVSVVGEHLQWRGKALEERIEYALIKGDTQFAEEDIKEAVTQYSAPISIIEGPMMSAMEKIGEMFESGKMFLPQVVKSAKAMKVMVAILQPEIELHNSVSGGATSKGRVVIATAKGDVHDIGKNIVSIVLSCNNFEVIDLGVMVDNNDILEAAILHKADAIGVSGLITPSLKQMENLCRMVEANTQRIIEEVGHPIPLIVGGATTSSVHTAVKLATLLSDINCVIYGGDASRTSVICKKLLRRDSSDSFVEEMKNEQSRILNLYKGREHNLLTIEQARASAPHFPREFFIQPDGYGENNLFVKSLNLNELIDRIDWTAFLNFWGFKGRFPQLVYSDTEEGRQAESLYEQAIAMLGEVMAGDEFEASLVLNFFDSFSRDENIIIKHDDKEILSLPMPRRRVAGSECLSLADYFPTTDSSILGLFALKVEDKRRGSYDEKDFEYLLRHSLCARLADAMAQWMEENVTCGAHAIRPAFGYSVCPDHSLKAPVMELLDAKGRIGLSMTESFALIPTTSICGMIIVHPDAKYFDCHESN